MSVSDWGLVAFTMSEERQRLNEGDRPEIHKTAQNMILFDVI